MNPHLPAYKKYPKRGLIPPFPPRARVMREYFGALVNVPQRSTKLAQRCIDQINRQRMLDD